MGNALRKEEETLDQVEKEVASDHGKLLDNIYRYQRLIYDASRKYFLFGRDTLLKKMDIRPGDNVIEVGTGTARNLRLLAQSKPEANYFGLDASQEMLITAESKLKSLALDSKVNLAHGYAESYDPKALFGLEEKFDVIFFSYSLSMMPTWREALPYNLSLLKPGRSLYIVDFWDQAEMPSLFQVSLKKFLAGFHVKFEPALMSQLEEIDASKQASLSISKIGPRYAYIAELTKK